MNDYVGKKVVIKVNKRYRDGNTGYYIGQDESLVFRCPKKLYRGIHEGQKYTFLIDEENFIREIVLEHGNKMITNNNFNNSYMPKNNSTEEFRLPKLSEEAKKDLTDGITKGLGKAAVIAVRRLFLGW